jgi:cation:H+ antiporter
MILSVALLIIGFILLFRGSDAFIDAAASSAQKLHIPRLIIGTTLVAMGTSAPEAAISITAALRGSDGISIGNIIGSNITNIFLILGLTAVIGAPLIHKNTRQYELPFVGMITLLLCLIGLWFGAISRGAALLFLVLFVGFIAYTIVMARRGSGDGTEIKDISWGKTVIMIILGLAAIVGGGELITQSATKIATYFGASDRIIGLTLVAFGTSLPELVVSVTAAVKHEYDMAIGNIVGSNIFNILFVLGTAAMIRPMPFEKAFVTDGAIALMAVTMLMMFTAKNAKLGRTGGIIFLCAYAGYLVYLIL